MLSALEMAFIQYWERYISSVIIIIIIIQKWNQENVLGMPLYITNWLESYLDKLWALKADTVKVACEQRGKRRLNPAAMARGLTRY